MRSHAYLNTAIRILETYDGSAPLSAWLKNYFRQNKKYGAKDRKEISHLCYAYYRLGCAFAYLPLEEKIIKAVFLVSGETPFVVRELKPEWAQAVSNTVSEKMTKEDENEILNHLFPFSSHTSDQIDLPSFILSFLIQPDLHLRIRPGKKPVVLSKLNNQGIVFNVQGSDCIVLNNQTKLDGILLLDEEVVVQDASSQKVAQSVFSRLRHPSPEVWDCCAASGGKSILWMDHYPGSRLTVSDIRTSILHNLEARFRRAGIHRYTSHLLDLSKKATGWNNRFDVIICDAPCSGSGTWSRTPEQLYFFKEEKINSYSLLQKRIALNALENLKTGGYFLYITCSVFREENEEVVIWLQENTSLKLVEQQYWKGYNNKADTLYSALFQL